ncbi:MAG: adenylate/guanylate cyclase domain-containing protein [Cyanobacteria bacterium P01_F01_bin.53]
MALLIGVSLGSLLVGGTLSWLRFRREFEHQVFEHLTSVRASKGTQVEAYIKGIRDQLEIMGEDRTLVSAMVEFNAAYRGLQNEVISNEWIEAIETYYARDFLPALAENVDGSQIIANYRPLTQAAQYLQYNYVIGGGSDEANAAGVEDDSAYAKQHDVYHPFFQDLIDKYGYEDLYLINFDSGEIVYSVGKQPDYATSLDRGPYRRSGLAKVVEAVRNNPGRGFVQVVDFEPYVPKKAAPVAFFATPIFNGPHIVGIVALQLPPARLNDILVGTQAWEDEGLGETGQVYVVGEDTLMRSISRELLDDADAYRETLRRVGLSSETVDLVYELNTSVLLQPVDTVATEKAMLGESGTEIIQDYQGKQVLSAYAPLKLEDLRWAILAEMDKSEALGPVTMMQIYMSTAGVIIVLAIALLSGFIAQSFAGPVSRLIEASKKLRSGEPVSDIPLKGNDEFSQLGTSFKELANTLEKQGRLVQQKSLENDSLLKNILPAAVVPRFRQGDDPIVDRVQQATVLSAKILGLTSDAIAVALNALVNEFDQVAKQSGLEPQPTADNTYLAVCGLSDVHFDHQERGLRVAQQLLEIVQATNERHQVSLSLQIGLHSGSFMAGVIGTEPFVYKLWGETIQVATKLPEQAEPHQIVVTQPIYERLKDRHRLLSHGSMAIEGMSALPIWHLEIERAPVGSSA